MQYIDEYRRKQTQALTFILKTDLNSKIQDIKFQSVLLE